LQVLPTPAELACRAWLSIAHGAKGLFWYCHYTGSIGHDQTLEDFPWVWEAFRPLLADLKNAAPTVFAPVVAHRSSARPRTRPRERRLCTRWNAQWGRTATCCW